MPGISEVLPQGRYQGRPIHRVLQPQHSENHICFDSNAPDEAETGYQYRYRYLEKGKSITNLMIGNEIKTI